MKALSLSKSTPRNSQGNKLCARLIASTTRLPSRVTSGMHSVQPVATSTIVRVWMNEPATDVPPWATMSTSQKPGGGSFQSLKCPDRHFATDRRIEAHAATTAAGRHELRRAEHSVNRRSTDRENSFSIARVELQPAMPLKRWHQSRDHHHEPLTAYPIRRLPQRRHRVFDRCIVLAPARGPFLGPGRLPRPVSPKRAHRMLAMPAHCGAKLVENAPLLPPPRPTVALRHRRQNLAPRAHADPSRHRHHRSDSVTPAHSSAGICPVTFLVRQCAPR